MVSKEEENFLRILYLNYRVANESLHRFFDKLHPNLSADLHIPGNKATLHQLYSPPPGMKRVLYPGQWNILYPPGNPIIKSSDLDLTLMVCLLLNIPPLVKAPVSGFDFLPHLNDKSDGANIARLKYYKNFLESHAKDGTLSNADFENIWRELEQAIRDLDNSPATAAKLKDAETKILDASMTQPFLHQIKLETKILDASMTQPFLHQIKLETQLSDMQYKLEELATIFEQDTQERKDLKKMTDNLQETVELKLENLVEKFIKENISALTANVSNKMEDKDADINRKEEDHIPQHIRACSSIKQANENTTLYNCSNEEKTINLENVQHIKELNVSVEQNKEASFTMFSGCNVSVGTIVIGNQNITVTSIDQMSQTSSNSTNS